MNQAADTLSRIPSYIDRYMKAYTQETSEDVISATVSGIMALQNGSSVWITAVIDRTEALNLDSDFLDASKYHRIELHDILAAQKRNPSTAKVVAYKIGGHQPAPHEIHKELSSVRTLLREEPKVEVGVDGLLTRKFTAGVTKAISSFGLQGVASRDGPLGGGVSTTVTS